MYQFFFRYVVFLLLQLTWISLSQAAQCSYKVLGEWDQGFTISIKILNDGNQVIEGWSVNWAYSDGSTVNGVWNATLSGTNPYTATAVAHNSTIAVGEAVEFGFNGSKGTAGNPAQIPIVTGTVCTSAANAYQLDATASTLYFASTKKIHVVETHTFDTLTGVIKNNGKVALSVDLSSVNTANATRDERMRDSLFEVTTFPSAEVTLTVDLSIVNSLSVGTSKTMPVNAILNLHGLNVNIETHVNVHKLSVSKIVVQNTMPLIIKAGDYALTDGIEVLRNLANLSVISHAVPVNFTLFFNAP